MRVCHIISGDLWAGAEVQAYLVIKEMAKWPEVYVMAVVFNEGILSAKIREIGVSVHLVAEEVKNASAMLFDLFRVLHNKQIDVLHVHGFKENFLGGVIGRLIAIKGIVRTHHGRGMLQAGTIYWWMEKINAKLLTDRLISVSEELRHFLLEARFDGKKIRMVRNGIDPSLAQVGRKAEILKKEYGIPEDSVVIGTMGRMEPVKGYRYFLEGAKEISSRANNVIFVLVGDGSLLSRMQDYSRTLGISELVLFPGFTSTPIDWLELFDIFTMTSLHEGTPMTLLEAMSLGKPAIVTNVGGMSEMVQHEYSGLLIEPGEPSSFADTALRLLGDKKLRDVIGGNAKSETESRWSLRATVQQTMKVYEEIV